MFPSKRISIARRDMVMYFPFWGMISMKLELQRDNTIKSGQTNGSYLKYNDEYIQKQTDQQLLGFWAKAAGHCALLHHLRMGDRDPELANKAMDYALNPILLEAGFELPEGYLYDSRFKDKPFEEIYNLLHQEQTQDTPEQQNQNEQGDGQTGNSGGQNQSSQESSQDSLPDDTQNENLQEDTSQNDVLSIEVEKSDDSDQEIEWSETLIQAGHLHGDMPEQFKRMVSDIVNPKIPWQSELMDFMVLYARNDYNWSKPNKRFLKDDIVLPSLINNELPEIAIFIDISASITEEQLQIAGSETSGVLEMFDTIVHVNYIDTKVKEEQGQVFTKADMPLKFNYYGGGGTDFRPAFEWLEKQDFTPACVIYFTDLEGDFPETEPEWPVLWIEVPDERYGLYSGKVPFGKHIIFE